MYPPHHFIPLFWLYARSYLVVTAVLTAFVASQCWRYGSGPLSFLIYFKLITTAILALTTYRRHKPSQAFYQNFGLTPLLLLGCAIGLDLLCCAILIALIL